jgi:drug/metabolite transporter (DMT)-like permease
MMNRLRACQVCAVSGGIEPISEGAWREAIDGMKSAMLSTAMWMLASILASTIELMLVHGLGPGWPAPLQLFWRQASGLLILAPFIARAGKAAFITSSPGIILFRSVAAMLALALWIYALSHLPLATATTLSFTRPLWIVLLASFILGERIGTVRGLAVCLGFVGVLVMVQPGASTQAPLAQAAAVGASLLFAFSFVSIKAMTSGNDPLVITVYSCLLGTLFTAAPAVWLWRAPTLLEGLTLFGLGITSLTAFFCMLRALSLQGAASLMPLDYLRLPLAVLLGFAVFGERPGLAALAGGAIILLAALTTTVGERISGRKTSGMQSAGKTKHNGGRDPVAQVYLGENR